MSPESLHYPLRKPNWKAVEYKKILTDVSAVTFIRIHGLNHRQFKTVFLDKINSECGNTVHYSEVHLLSKCKVLQCFLSLLGETRVFLIKKRTASHFTRCNLGMRSHLLDTCAA
jgi:hypothetical protein